MVDILQEIEEDLRHERVNAIAKKYGPFLAAAVVVILAITGGYIWWTNRISDRAERLSLAYHQAATSQDTLNQTTQLQEIAQNNEGFGVLARFKLGALNLPSSPASLASITSTTAPDALKNTARVLAIVSAMDTVTATTAPGVMADLTALEKDAPSFAPLAQVLRAQILLFLGKKDEAQEVLRQVQDNPKASPDVVELAQAYLQADQLFLASNAKGL